MSVGIVTDTSCDLSIAALLKLGVAVVPHKILVGSEVHRDWRDVDPPTLFEWMTVQGLLPGFEAPVPEDFVSIYWKFLETHDHLISIHLSKNLSKTLEHAKEAAKALQAEDRISFVDSASVSVTLAEMVMSAAELAREDAPLAHILWSIERIRNSAMTLITPESLDWLIKREQLGRTAGLLSNVTRQRPLFKLEHGAIIQESSINYHRVADILVKTFHDKFNDTPIRLALGLAGDNRADIEGLKRSFEVSGLEIIHGRVQMVGSYLGCLYGPGTLLVCVYPDLSAALAL